MQVFETKTNKREGLTLEIISYIALLNSKLKMIARDMQITLCTQEIDGWVFRFFDQEKTEARQEDIHTEQRTKSILSHIETSEVQSRIPM